MGRAAPVALLCAAGLAGCGTTAKSQVQKKVDQFLTATKTGDDKTLCTQVLAQSLLSHLTDNGIPCEKAMQIGLAGVKDPQLAIGKIDVNGDRATVTVITTATGQEASLDGIALVKESAGWRVSALVTPNLKTGSTGSTGATGGTATGTGTGTG